MTGQDFSALVAGGLLQDVEKIVVEALQRHGRSRGRPYSLAEAYRWLRYENAEPVARLAEGVRKLRRVKAQFDEEAVDKACAKAAHTGFLN